MGNGNPFWLPIAALHWYADYLASGSAFVWSALVSCVVGVFLSLTQRRFRALAMLLSLAFSLTVLSTAGYFRGELRSHEDTIGAFFLIASMTQVGMGVGVLWWARGGRLAALLMVPQCYAFWTLTAFVSSMSLADSWL